MEIGSIYEMNRAKPESSGTEGGACVPVHGAAGGLRLPEVMKYRKANVCYTGSGREAIALALRSLEEHNPSVAKRCLLPAYMCDTVFPPFERGGWELSFYPVGRNMETGKEELLKRIETVRPGLLFIHAYYGADTWKPMRSLLKEWQRQGICVMEDVTQSYYLEGAGREADYVVGSLRKWYPIPDGGFVASDLELPVKELPVHARFVEERVRLLSAKWDYLYGGKSRKERKALKEDYLKRNREMEEWLDRCDGIGSLSAVSEEILAAQDEKRCRNRRNENYRILYETVKWERSFSPVMETFHGDAAPLYFPIYAKDQKKLQEFLRTRDIYAPVLWPVGTANEAELSGEERFIFGHLLALPMDQRYGAEAMEQIRVALSDYEERDGHSYDRNTGGCQ